MSNFLTPAEIAESCVAVGVKKASLSIFKMILLGVLGGAFIAFAAQGSASAIHTIGSVGVGKALAGALFSTGLMLVLIAGGELFTGNCLMVIGLFERKINPYNMFKNWIVVYLANFVGAFLIATFIHRSGQLNFSDGLLGGFSIKTAVNKTNLTFEMAFFSGLLCNWLVCLAVYMSYGAKDIGGKVLAIFFPIWLFITSGFEHCVANMYYIPIGILSKSNMKFRDAAVSIGVSAESISRLSWEGFFTKNLLPVTLGNIVGGCLFVGVFYWFSYVRKTERNI